MRTFETEIFYAQPSTPEPIKRKATARAAKVVRLEVQARRVLVGFDGPIEGLHVGGADVLRDGAFEGDAYIESVDRSTSEALCSVPASLRVGDEIVQYEVNP